MDGSWTDALEHSWKGRREQVYSTSEKQFKNFWENMTKKFKSNNFIEIQQNILFQKGFPLWTA